LKELQYRDDLEKTTNFLSQINITSKRKVALTKLEWTKKYGKDENVEIVEVIDLDSNENVNENKEENVLKMLTQVNHSYMKHLFKYLNNLFLLISIYILYIYLYIFIF